MITYVSKRILLLIPVLLGVTFIIFTIMSFVPGDPGRMILGENATREAVELLNEKLGVNRPFFVRFCSYIYNAVVHFDLGTSYRTSKPVMNDVLARVRNSFMISFNGILAATVLGVPLGILSAVRQYSAIDNMSRVSAMMAAAIPSFWFGMMLIYLFASKWRVLPASGANSWKHFILPMITLGIPYAGSQLRMTRSAMLETIRADYVRTARAKGVPQAVVIFRHALRNALLPIVTTTATSFGGLLGGAIITETIFSIPGLGTLIVTSIRQRDTPTVLGATITLALLFGIVMLMVDLFYAFVDPRIKAKYTR